MKKLLSLILVLAVAVTMFAACGDPASTTTPDASVTTPETSATTPDSTVETPAGEGGTIYYLNFKPEIADVYQAISAAYLAETGVTLEVQTAAAGEYEQKLRSEMAKSTPPVLFQINGPRGYASWKDYTADLSGTQLYEILNDKGLAITGEDGGVYGIPYVVEGYGIIYNNAIMNAYFALENRGTPIASMDEVRDFASLKAVVEDMTARKDELGLAGVFASTSLKPGEDWRWQTHLANIPVAAEFKAGNVDLSGDGTKEVAFTYNENFKNIFDLYLNNSMTDPALLGTIDVNTSMSEFALGEVAMVQNGNWAWSQINGFDDNTVAEEDIKFLPIYTGIDGEASQGLAIGTENFFSINKQAPEDQQKLAADFIYWLYSSDTGKAFVTDELNFIAPFSTFTPAERPQDPLAQEIGRWMEMTGVSSVPWNFTVFPNQTFKDAFGADLLQYAQGNTQWDAVTTNFVTNWKVQSEA